MFPWGLLFRFSDADKSYIKYVKFNLTVKYYLTNAGCQAKLVGRLVQDMNEIGDAFSVALRRMLKKEALTIGAAAKRLEVSRQTFHSYLGGTLPRRKMLNKAVHMWDLKLDLGKDSFGKGAFGPEQGKGKAAPGPSQPTLWEALDSVREEDLQVSIKRVGKVLRVDVKIEIPA